MKKETKKAPTIRFQGFTDDWEQRKLLDLLDQPITDGPHETPNIVDDGVPFISADAIVNNKIDFSRKRGNITEEYNLECCKKYKPELYDVYLVKSGSTVGKVAIVETTEKFNIWSPLAAMRCQKKSNPYFLFFLLQTRKIQTQVKDKSSNGTQPNLSMRILEKFDVIVPQNKEEQLAIGCFFQKLDNTLTLHQRKLDQLKTLKKYFLQNMFPAKGEKVPRIRFKGFTGDWEQRKLGECCQEFKSGSFISASDIGDVGKYPVYGGNGLRGFSAEYNHDGEFALIGRQGALCGNMNYSVGRAYFTEHAIAVQANKTADTKFLYYLLRKMNLGQYSDQSAQPGLAVGKLVKLTELFPSVAEQIKIGHQFMGIDNLITLHQRKLDQFQMMKKFMLQNLFI